MELETLDRVIRKLLAKKIEAQQILTVKCTCNSRPQKTCESKHLALQNATRLGRILLYPPSVEASSTAENTSDGKFETAIFSASTWKIKRISGTTNKILVLALFYFGTRAAWNNFYKSFVPALWQNYIQSPCVPHLKAAKQETARTIGHHAVAGLYGRCESIYMALRFRQFAFNINVESSLMDRHVRGSCNRSHGNIGSDWGYPVIGTPWRVVEIADEHLVGSSFLNRYEHGIFWSV